MRSVMQQCEALLTSQPAVNEKENARFKKRAKREMLLAAWARGFILTCDTYVYKSARVAINSSLFIAVNESSLS